jgi:hypothetical protein
MQASERLSLEDIVNGLPPGLPPVTHDTFIRLQTNADVDVARYISRRRAPLANIPNHCKTFVEVVDVTTTVGTLSSVEKKFPILPLQTGDILEVVQRWSGEYWRGVKLLPGGEYGESGFFSTDTRVVRCFPLEITIFPF